MGTASRGPQPKRSDQRVRRNVESRPDTITTTGQVRPPGASRDWHPAVRRWYRALGRSAQREYFEPSDWEHARLVAELLSDELAGSPRATMVNAIFAAMKGLGVTEGDRRRMRIEVERSGEDGTGDDYVSDLEAYRRRATGD